MTGSKRVGNYYAWPLVTDLWPWQLNGVQWKRTWPIGETREVLTARWRRLMQSPVAERGNLMRETEARTVEREIIPFPHHENQTPQNESGIQRKMLPSVESLSADARAVEMERYAWRSFDRHWILPDNRFCDRPRPDLWTAHGERQVYISSLLTGVLGPGPAASASAHPPDLHHFRGSYGGKGIVPLWRDVAGAEPNLPSGLLDLLTNALSNPVSAEDFFAYTYAVLSAPSYVETFAEELALPGPRLPITSDAGLFTRAVVRGRRLLWLHTYAERFVPADHRQGQVPAGLARCIKSVPGTPDAYPTEVSWQEGTMPGLGVLHVGLGEFAPVSRAVWEFSLSGYDVVKSWLGFRLKARSGKKSSPLDDLRPAAWTASLTTELLELLWVVESTLADIPLLNELLAEIIEGTLINATAFPVPTEAERKAPGEDTPMTQSELYI